MTTIAAAVYHVVAAVVAVVIAGASSPKAFMAVMMLCVAPARAVDTELIALMRELVAAAAAAPVPTTAADAPRGLHLDPVVLALALLGWVLWMMRNPAPTVAAPPAVSVPSAQPSSARGEKSKTEKAPKKTGKDTAKNPEGKQAKTTTQTAKPSRKAKLGCPESAPVPAAYRGRLSAELKAALKSAGRCPVCRAPHAAHDKARADRAARSIRRGTTTAGTSVPTTSTRASSPHSDTTARTKESGAALRRTGAPTRGQVPTTTVTAPSAPVPRPAPSDPVASWVATSPTPGVVPPGESPVVGFTTDPRYSTDGSYVEQPGAHVKGAHDTTSDAGTSYSTAPSEAGPSSRSTSAVLKYRNATRKWMKKARLEDPGHPRRSFCALCEEEFGLDELVFPMGDQSPGRFAHAECPGAPTEDEEA